MKKYFNVCYQVSETIYSANIAHAETAEDVAAYYAKKSDNVQITEAHDYDVAAAQRKGMPVVEIDHQDATKDARNAAKSAEPTEDTINTESGAESAENEKGADTMTTTNTTTTSPAAQMFPRLCAEIRADEQRRKENTAFYILRGYMPTWAERERTEGDRGLRQYSTPRRWEQYQRGEIDREKAVELATKKAAKKIEQDTAAKLAQLEAAATAPRFDSVSISVTWAKSRTWGANPTAEVLNLGDRRTVGHASGCGYDKESAAIAEALNQNPAALRVLYELGESALARGDSPRSKSACSGYHCGCCLGYGAGYSVLPYFKGGVGSSCFWSIFQKAGFSVRLAGSGKMFDCWTLQKGGA